MIVMHGAVLGRSLVELVLERDRGGVSAENLRAKVLHVRLQVLVQIAGLCKPDRKLQRQCIQRKKDSLKHVDAIK